MTKYTAQHFNFSRMFKSGSLSLFLLAFVILLMSPIACVDLEFDEPPTGGFDPNLPVNTTIAELKARHTLDNYEQITDDVTISGLVISNDEAGNFFKQLVLQDETGGIEMRIEMTDLHNVYPVGRKLYVKAKGLWLGDYNGLIQLGAGVDAGDLIRIPESIVDRIIIPATYGHPVAPKVLSIDQLTLADVSTLVQLTGIQFVVPDAGETWADPVLQETINREIEDCSMNRMIVRTSGFASFAGDLTPSGKGTMIGVLSVFGSDFQIMIRDLNDVVMTEERCGSIGILDNLDESFTGLGDNVDIAIPGWTNIAIKGSRVWRSREFSGNYYAQATAFSDTSPEMETWLITPRINLNTPKKLTFESAQSFWVHDGLSVWISSNFDGINVAAATWTQLNPVLATSSDAPNAFVSSGVIDLTGITGPVRIGFKYTGSGPNGQTTTFRVDNVNVSSL